MTAAAVQQQDIPVVQGVVLFAATVFVLVNLIVDLIYPLVDPRIVLTGGGKRRRRRRLEQATDAAARLVAVRAPTLRGSSDRPWNRPEAPDERDDRTAAGLPPSASHDTFAQTANDRFEDAVTSTPGALG